MEPGHKSKGFGRQKANLTCIWCSRWPGGSAAGKWTHALLGLILTCVSSTSTAAPLWHYSVMPYTTPIKNQEVFKWKTVFQMQPRVKFLFSISFLAQEEEGRKEWGNGVRGDWAKKAEIKQYKLLQRWGKVKLESNLVKKTTKTTNVLSKCWKERRCGGGG